MVCDGVEVVWVVIMYNSSVNEVFETALEIAVKAHKKQVDKNGLTFVVLTEIF